MKATKQEQDSVSLTLTWDVFKLQDVENENGGIAFNFNMRCI